MLTEHSEEVRGATLPNFVGDRVFNGIFAERKLCQLNAPASCMHVTARLLLLLLIYTIVWLCSVTLHVALPHGMFCCFSAYMPGHNMARACNVFPGVDDTCWCIHYNRLCCH